MFQKIQNLHKLNQMNLKYQMILHYLHFLLVQQNQKHLMCPMCLKNLMFQNYLQNQKFQKIQH